MKDKLFNALRWISYRFGLNFYRPLSIWHGLPQILDRPFDSLALAGVGCEVGVYSGFHARSLLRRHPETIKLHLVDPYLPYDSPTAVGYLDEAKECAYRLMEKFGERVCWHLDLEEVPELNWCYIDGNHDYLAVASDIETIWPRIKPGGILGGHDFHPNMPGVIQAVVDFVWLHDPPLTLNVITPDWWVRKAKPVIAMDAIMAERQRRR